MSFVVPRALPLSLLAALVLAGCAEKGRSAQKGGEARRCGERCAAENARQREGSQRVGRCAGKNL